MERGPRRGWNRRNPARARTRLPDGVGSPSQAWATGRWTSRPVAPLPLGHDSSLAASGPVATRGFASHDRISIVESASKVLSIAAGGLLIALGLTGCLSSGSGFAVLDAPAQPGDVLPTELPDYAYDGLDPASSRFVGEHDGDRLYLAKGANASACLIVYPNNQEWVIGCGGGDGSVTVGNGTRKYEVQPDDAPAPNGAEEISPNVFVVD